MNATNALITTNGGEKGDISFPFSPSDATPPRPPSPALRIDALLAALPELRQAFLSATPWPHLVLDDMTDPDVVGRAEKEETAFAAQLRPHKTHRMVKAESSVPGGPTAKAILQEMLSPPFIELIEGITGIKDLIGDPEHFWGGLHVSGKGAFQCVHTDFERHPMPGLYHRVNVLLYLNSEWEPGFGGELEMWPKSMAACGRRVEPLLGRMVIFVTDPNTIHGVPDPITCPPDRYRLSLASYYYTTEQPELISFRDRILQAQRPQDPWVRSVVGPSNAIGALRVLARRAFKPSPIAPSAQT